MKTLVTVTMAFDWPEDELYELATEIDAGIKKSMIAAVAPVAMDKGYSSEEVDEILAEHLEWYGVTILPRRPLSIQT